MQDSSVEMGDVEMATSSCARLEAAEKLKPPSQQHLAGASSASLPRGKIILWFSDLGILTEQLQSFLTSFLELEPEPYSMFLKMSHGPSIR